MTRIFFVLAWFAVLCLVATLIIGFSLGDIRHDISPAVQRWGTMHRLTGVATAMAVVLVNCICVTYFIGTSRWCKEVVETYRLDNQFIRRGTSLKRRTFPWALLSMLTVLGIVALGGAADPSTGRATSEAWAMPHMLAALGGFAFIVMAFFMQWQNIATNHELIEEVLAEVRRIRTERGLEV
jgi:hypothetical protein